VKNYTVSASIYVGSVIFFQQEWRFSRSGSSKVIDFGTKRKRVCDFLLVRHSKLGPVLHRFGDIAAFMCSWPHPYSTLICRMFPLHQIAHGEVSLRMSVKLFGHEIIFEVFRVFQRMCSRYLNVTDHSCSTRAKRTLFSAKSARTLAPFIMRTLKIDNKRTVSHTLFSHRTCWTTMLQTDRDRRIDDLLTHDRALRSIAR